MKVVTVLGARPQFIKASVVSAEFQKYEGITEVVVHTGQHFDANMSGVFFSELGMQPPAYSLDIHGGTHGAMTGRMLVEVERVLLDEKPDVVLVYGDTNSTLAGALAAAKLHIPVAHVEAGLRSFNMRMPEEVNRILTDRVSQWLFTPTDDAVKHLRSEGLDENRICPVGDVMYDVALHYGKRAAGRENSMLSRWQLEEKNYVLATVHRAENTDVPERLSAIVNAFVEVTETLPVVLPLHPRTKAALEREGLMQKLEAAITLVPPLGYLDMVELESKAAVIATDSGGVQKEAFFHQVPCVTLRDETEWVELVESGWNRLASLTSKISIAETISSARYRKGSKVEPYGRGDSASLIVKKLI